MMKIAMSAAGSALLRGLVARAGVERHRILLSDSKSTEWQSMTFTGERHWFALRITGADSSETANRMCEGLEDAELSIPGMFVADISVVETSRRAADGAAELTIEALTILAD
jgi:hypothetical protein